MIVIHLYYSELAESDQEVQCGDAFPHVTCELTPFHKHMLPLKLILPVPYIAL